MDRVKLLLQFKADAGLPNHKGELPIHRACISDLNIEVGHISTAQSTDWTSVIHQALLYLVELCPDINVPDGDGWTPLMFAAKSGSSAIAKYLVQRGANPNLTQVGPVPILPHPILHVSIPHVHFRSVVLLLCI